VVVSEVSICEEGNQGPVVIKRHKIGGRREGGIPFYCYLILPTTSYIVIPYFVSLSVFFLLRSVPISSLSTYSSVFLGRAGFCFVFLAVGMLARCLYDGTLSSFLAIMMTRST
jgi:hypothetical protein